jgi:hypothetical protein
LKNQVPDAHSDETMLATKKMPSSIREKGGHVLFHFQIILYHFLFTASQDFSAGITAGRSGLSAG